ncbi:hypothetical protein NDA16_004692 [Ustilago loliicola]|nr:hypothetical protein NDA16_004692 [Ustilago loliicola]
MVTNDPKVRDRVRTLTALAADLERLQKSPTEVLEAAKVVRALGNAYFKVRSRMNTHFPPPEWLMPPPPFPAWQSPELETPKEPAASGRRGSRGQKRSSDNGSTQERRVRGRGAVRADDDFDADARNVKVDPEPSDLLRLDTGITIRGASQAESRVPKWEPDVYRPESSLFARLDRRDDEPRYGGMGSHAPRDYSGSYASSLYHSGGDDYGYHSYHRHDEYASYGSHSYPHDEPRYRNDDPRGASSWGYSRR